MAQEGRAAFSFAPNRHRMRPFWTSICPAPTHDACRPSSAFASPPLIVFTTGHAHRACEAFRIEAVDYLLKPLEPAHILGYRLSIAEATGPASRSAPARSEPVSETGPGFHEGRLPVRSGREDVTLLLPRWEIVAALRHDRRTWIHTAQAEYETYYPLTVLLRRSSGSPFSACRA